MPIGVRAAWTALVVANFGTAGHRRLHVDHMVGALRTIPLTRREREIPPSTLA